MKSNYEIITEFLFSRRTVSVLNIAEGTGADKSDVIDSVKRLHSEGLIRLGGSVCSSSCSSCSDKCGESVKEVSGESIVIPLFGRRSSDEY
ncbi:MAG: hypothetical protein KA015_00370 [Spirochaetes bacterium]|nr:hypothetical protein [Spirochaetota bacterium]